MGGILDVCSTITIGGLKADFIGKGNIWIDNTYQQEEINLARYIIYQAMTQTAPGQLSIWGYDSDLSGIFAPFSSLSAGEARVLKLISDHKDLTYHLDYIKQQIQATQNVIQGRNDSLIEFRSAIQRPVENYKLIVLSLDMGTIDAETRSKISLLMRNGPKFGVSFLIISTTIMSVETISGKEIDIKVEAIAPNITVVEVDGTRVKKADEKAIAYNTTTKAPEHIIKSCEEFIEKTRYAQLPTIKFTETNDTTKMWNQSSIHGLTFSIGKFGINNMEITIGDEVNQRHNAVITGAVGQGKSNLISIIIHSLCQRYSPKELQMYLLDFKEGVTFKPFSNIGQDEYLPHAKALGLESDISFGVAVLESLFEEYQRRMNVLKENDVKSLRELRINQPSIELPRILVIIDEFQMMFNGNEGDKAVELLEKSVRLFRAAGIHFILASQTLRGNERLGQKIGSIFSQVPIRIALKNSIPESQQTLSQNNTAAAFLMPREAIVNLDYGDVIQNRKTIVAFADEKVLKPLRKIWWEKSKQFTCPPYIFESERRITISNSIDTIKEARNKGNGKGESPIALIGDKISVDGKHVVLPLTDEPGRNIAIIGTSDRGYNQAAGIMQSIAISLAMQNTKGTARFLFCDFESKDIPYDKRYPKFSEIMEDAGYFIETIYPSDFEAEIKNLNQQEQGEEVYVFCSVLDRWRYEADPYGQGNPLKTFVENAPAKKMHLIGWWIKASSFTSQIAGYGTTDAFNSKIFLRSDERSVQSLTSPFVKWVAQSNRALVSDRIEFSEEVVCIPYSPITQEDVIKFRNEYWDA